MPVQLEANVTAREMALIYMLRALAVKAGLTGTQLEVLT